MLAIDPNSHLGKQVFLALNNGLRLELNVDSSDMTFMGNFAIGHQVEICSAHRPTHRPTHGASAPAAGTAAPGTSQGKQPFAHPGAASRLAFNITDRVTGTYGKARLTSHVFISR